MDSKKSTTLAYFFWLVGGIFGLHHFYLGRDKHAFITFATFGGYFTLGLVRDLWRMPEYVKDANNDLEYVQQLHKLVKRFQKPPSSISRQSGLMIMGNLLAYLIEYAIPEELLPKSIYLMLKFLLVPFGSALGVWLTGNVGRHEGGIGKPLLAAYLATLGSILFGLHPGSFSTLAATIVFNRYCKRWRLKKEESKPLLLRILVMAICITLYLSLWSSWLYYGCSIEDPETLEPIKCRVAYENFRQSTAFTNIYDAIMMLVQHLQYQGISGLWREMMQEFDVSGKNTALATLGLDDDATPEQILVQYKKLSREYHPDKEKDESKKAEKHEKFIQVQEAFSKLQSTVQRYRLQERARQQEADATPEPYDEL